MLDKIKKIAVVVFLTLLIWAWAYLALEEEFTQTATLYISQTSPDLLVSFDDIDTPVAMKLRLKGSAAKVAELKRKLNAKDTDPDKERLDFYYNAETEKQADPGTHMLELLPFLNKSTKMRGLGITVESCTIEKDEVATIAVTVEKLVKQWLAVQCFDEIGTILEHETIIPARIEMFVRQGDSSGAKVTLTRQQIEQARKFPIVETPYVQLAPATQRFAATRVKIKLPPAEVSLQARPLQPTIGFIFSKNLKDKYSVELLNENELTSVTQFRATDAAWAAYDKTPYQVLVEIRDGDEAAQEVSREVAYNFPLEFAEKGEIELNAPRGQAKFRIVPVAPAPVLSPGP
jgi:hypothetical protein